jgi:hypothetical protein
VQDARHSEDRTVRAQLPQLAAIVAVDDQPRSACGQFGVPHQPTTAKITVIEATRFDLTEDYTSDSQAVFRPVRRDHSSSKEQPQRPDGVRLDPCTLRQVSC